MLGSYICQNIVGKDIDFGLRIVILINMEFTALVTNVQSS